MLLAVNEEDAVDKIREYFAKEKFTFRGWRAKPDAATKPYKVSMFPTNYVIGADGKIAAGFIGFDADGLKSAVEKLTQK